MLNECNRQVCSSVYIIMVRLPVRNRLIETASKLFYEQGYNRTGINEILEKSGVAKASMYQHFRSKEEIGVEYLKYMEKEMMDDLNEFLGERKKGRDRVLGIFDFVHHFYNTDTFRGCWCQNTMSEIPKGDKVMGSEIREQKDRFRAYLGNLVEEDLGIEDSRVVDRIYLMYEVALNESQLYMEDWPIIQAREMVENILDNN